MTTESGMSLVAGSVSQGDELNASWFNIIEMVDPLSADSASSAAWGYGTVAIQLENPHCKVI